MPDLKSLYRALNKLSKADLGAPAITDAIIEMSNQALLELGQIAKLNIISSIPEKEYFVFDKEGKYSRPINRALFLDSLPDNFIASYSAFNWDGIDRPLLQRCLYTVAMSYCASADILGRGDKITPSIFFEIFIGNIFAREFAVNPSTQVEIPIQGVPTTLPTDFIFQPANQHLKIHLPIKLSTRERSVQAWAHQRVLEGIFGVGQFKGVMVIMAETNFQSEELSVVEVCLPDQWRIYQMFISQMARIYYLDLPKKYEELPGTFPHIQVKPFSAFFDEKNHILNPPV